MSTRAIIAIALDDGTFLASRVTYDGGDRLHDTLADCYGSRYRAGDLISLGDLSAVGRTPAACTPHADDVPHDEAMHLADRGALYAAMRVNEDHLHVFERGAWTHELSEDEEYRRSLDERD